MDGSRKQTEDCGESIAPHAPPSPGGAFHTPNRGPRIRITRSNMENFKVGDTVQWASSANGSWKEKKGIVESVIPAGGNPQIYATRVAEKYGRKIPHLGYPRDHVSYIVRVPSKTGGVGKFYRPHVALLEKAE